MKDKELKLKELRLKYPTIKATSKTKFLQLVEEQEVVEIVNDILPGIIEEVNVELVELLRIKDETINQRMSHNNYVYICTLHAKHFNHKLKMICKCKPTKILQWLDELIEKLS